MSIDYRRIPKRTMESLQLWVSRGVLPGSFLQAVLANDLMGAVVRADDENRAAFVEIVYWLRCEVPCECHGSLDHMGLWRRKHQVELADAALIEQLKGEVSF